MALRNSYSPQKHDLVQTGFPRYILDKYNNALKKAAWLTYEGMWRSAASGVGKGIMLAVASVMFTAAVIGGLAITPHLATGVMEGLTLGLGVLTKYALPILTSCAALGAAYDVSVKQSSIQKELAEIRLQMRNHKGMQQEAELNRDPDFVPDEGIERSANYWQQRTSSGREYPQGQGLS